MALSIMLYHIGGKNDSATVLGKLGIYGVSIFFILSGLSMAIAYDRHIDGVRSAAVFLVRRLFRIWPLLWLAITVVAVQGYFLGKPYDARTIALNLSTAFGFVEPTAYINQGAWSIGNEMVYYALTPLLIPIFRRWRMLGNLLTLFTFAIAGLFAFRWLNPNQPLGDQWALYVHPINNLFLYCAGVALFYNMDGIRIFERWRIPLLVLPLAALLLYPAAGDQISIATGIDRVVLSLISIAIVVAFYKCPLNLPAGLAVRLEQLGIATYGVYLLHPIVADWTRRLLTSYGLFRPALFAVLVIAITIPLALLIYRCFELPFIRLGRRLTTIPVYRRKPIRT